MDNNIRVVSSLETGVHMFNWVNINIKTGNLSSVTELNKFVEEHMHSKTYKIIENILEYNNNDKFTFFRALKHDRMGSILFDFAYRCPYDNAIIIGPPRKMNSASFRGNEFYCIKCDNLLYHDIKPRQLELVIYNHENIIRNLNR